MVISYDYHYDSNSDDNDSTTKIVLGFICGIISLLTLIIWYLRTRAAMLNKEQEQMTEVINRNLDIESCHSQDTVVEEPDF
jgi:hypothetical protein